MIRLSNKKDQNTRCTAVTPKVEHCTKPGADTMPVKRKAINTGVNISPQGVIVYKIRYALCLAINNKASPVSNTGKTVTLSTIGIWTRKQKKSKWYDEENGLNDYAAQT